MTGDIENLVTLYEWGINLLAEGYKVEFDDIINLIKLKHENTDHIMFHDIKENLDKND